MPQSPDELVEILALQSAAGPEVSITRGKTAFVPRRIADDLIRAGFAELVAKSKPSRKTAKRTAESSTAAGRETAAE